MAVVDSPRTPAVPISHFPANWTVADLQSHLGGIPVERVRLHPPPGSATKKDVQEILVHSNRICELIDGVLVEKTVGYKESLLAAALGLALGQFVREHKLGKVLGADGALEILADQVRAAAVCFISRGRFPDGKLPEEAIPPLVPDLAVEVLSKGNTKAEMDRKLRDYFTAGVRLVWYIDPRTRTAKAYTVEDQCAEFDENGSLSGGDVLPGFQLSLRELFAELDL
jgi:Uma2 family endonuclease